MNASHLTPEAANLDPLRLNDVILSNDMKSYRVSTVGSRLANLIRSSISFVNGTFVKRVIIQHQPLWESK